MLVRPALRRFALFFLLVGQASTSPVVERQVDGQGVVNSATLDGVTYLNKGLVGFGRIASDVRESTGDTLGGFGSAAALKRGSWKKKRDKFYGTFVAHPDRGYNVDVTINYQARQHELDFVFTPYYGSANLTWEAAQETLKVTYKKTTLLYERKNKKTTGLDPLSFRKAQFGNELLPLLDPVVPIASKTDDRLVLDVEGLVLIKDGTYWISDEYGAYIYRFSSSGHLLQTIQPPSAIVPRNADGSYNFTSQANPATGRSPNQGFENLAYDSVTSTLYAMLQSATIQDGGSDKTTSRHSRLFAYDVGNILQKPKLIGEWVVPLPQSSKGKTLASSEIYFLSPGVFLALARDGDGRGGDDVKSKYKQADVFSIKDATNIKGTKFDNPANPVSPGGVLDSSIKPATYVSFIDYLNPTQLARFGLHNGGTNDLQLIASKWESFVLAPVGDKEFPDDYFLFTLADNDFVSRHGISLGIPFDAGLDIDNQFLVFRVTLPSVKRGSIEKFIGI